MEFGGAGIRQGDALELLRGLPDGCVDLCIADPPYYRVAGKEWDRQWRSMEEWAEWCLEWGREVVRVLRDCGSCFVFGDDKNVAYVQVRLDGLDWGLLNVIVWAKSNYTMLKADSEALRSFAVEGEERILFYGKDIGFPSFSEVRNPKAAQPMAQYLRSERERSGVSMGDVAALFPSKSGGLTGCVANWELGYNFPLEWQYEKIRELLNRGNGGGEYLRREYEDLRREYEDLRRPFFGGRYTDVWRGPAASASHKVHSCHKPVWLVRRMIQAATKPGAHVLDLFAGSGEVCV